MSSCSVKALTSLVEIESDLNLVALPIKMEVGNTLAHQCVPLNINVELSL